MLCKFQQISYIQILCILYEMHFNVKIGVNEFIPFFGLVLASDIKLTNF